MEDTKLLASEVMQERRERLKYLESLNIPEDHMCHNCIKYYKETLGYMPCSCKGGLDLLIERDIVKLGLADEEKDIYRTIKNPVLWAKEFLTDVDKNAWTARWYQEELLLCTSTKKAVRAGRRIGKTEALGIDATWSWHTIPNRKIMIIAPFQDQVNLIFNNIRFYIDGSQELSSAMGRNTRSPQRIENRVNGSFMHGITAGTRSGMKGDKARGQDATDMYWDEADYLDEATMDSLIGIRASRKDLRLWASTTPTGAREFFYSWCNDKKQGYKEFHYKSNVGPNWTKETEYEVRQTMSNTSYLHEFEAEFADSEVGVYQQSHIDACIRDYDPNKWERNWNQGYLYTLGVDWNEAKNGVRLIGLEYNPETTKIRVCSLISIHSAEFTQLKAVAAIRDLNALWKFDAIYVDQGYGETQIQILHKMGLSDPKSRLGKIVKGIKMGSKTSMYDPISKQEEKYHTKHLIVDMSARRIEVHQCILPASEDEKGGLVDEMRNFRAERVSADGIPTYSTENDHSIVAWQLALFALIYEFSPINRRSHATKVAFADVFNTHEEMPMGTRDMKQKALVNPRTAAEPRIVLSNGLQFVSAGFRKDPVARQGRAFFRPTEGRRSF